MRLAIASPVGLRVAHGVLVPARMLRPEVDRENHRIDVLVYVLWASVLLVLLRYA